MEIEPGNRRPKTFYLCLSFLCCHRSQLCDGDSENVSPPPMRTPDASQSSRKRLQATRAPLILRRTRADDLGSRHALSGQMRVIAMYRHATFDAKLREEKVEEEKQKEKPIGGAGIRSLLKASTGARAKPRRWPSAFIGKELGQGFMNACGHSWHGEHACLLDAQGHRRLSLKLHGEQRIWADCRKPNRNQ